MKKLLSMLCLLVTLFACSESDQDDTQKLIQDLQMPSSDIPLIENQLVTIQGKGFTSTSQIWLRVSGTKAQGDIQAEVTQANDKSLTFKVPANTIGKKEVILKQDGQEYLLGTLTFKEKERYYTFCYDRNKNEVAEIDIENGKLIWTGWKIPGFSINNGFVFNESGDELVGLDNRTGKYVIYRFNINTKELKTIKINDKQTLGFQEIIRFNDKYYALCSSSEKEEDPIEIEFVEIDIESGNLVRNGWKMPGLYAKGGYVFNESGSELIAIDAPHGTITARHTIYRLNMITKELKKIEIKNLYGAVSSAGKIVRVNNKYYSDSFNGANSGLAEIDIENGVFIWNGLNFPDFYYPHGIVFSESKNELLTLALKEVPEGCAICSLNMTTKESKAVDIKNLNGMLGFSSIIIRK